MITISNPVVCTIDNSTSKRPIQSDEAFGGRYNAHKRKGFEFVKDISVQRVSNLDVSISFLRLQFIELLKYKITPLPALSMVQHLSLRTNWYPFKDDLKLSP